MSINFLAPILGSINHPVVFGALIGIEVQYLVSRFPQKRLPTTTLLFLPILLGVSLFDNGLLRLLKVGSVDYLAPFLFAVIAACATALLAEVHARFNKTDPSQDPPILFWASVFAMCITVPFWNIAETSVLATLASATELWIGCALGLVCFSGIGTRLRTILRGRGIAGVAILFLTTAIIALVMAGFFGLALPVLR